MDTRGRIRPAPEGFLDRRQIAEVQAGRRDFLRGAFLAAAALPIAAASQPSPRPSPRGEGESAGDPAILELPEHSKGLGQPVAARAYGMPSQHEKNLQR